MSECIETALIGIDQKEVSVTLSSIDGGEFAVGDLISQSAVGQSDNGIIFDAVVRENGGTSELISAQLTEVKTSGDLQKGNALLLLFSTYSLSINSNDPFVLGGLATETIIGAVEFNNSDYIDVDSSTTICPGIIKLGNIKANSNTTTIKGILISKDTKRYDNHSLKIKLIFHRH